MDLATRRDRQQETIRARPGVIGRVQREVGRNCRRKEEAGVFPMLRRSVQLEVSTGRISAIVPRNYRPARGPDKVREAIAPARAFRNPLRGDREPAIVRVREKDHPLAI